MNTMWTLARPRLSLRVTVLGTSLSTLLLALALPVTAAPAEGITGQSTTSRPSIAAAPNASKPDWKELNSAQQQALLPLAPHWDRLSQARKRKWLVISKNYANLPPDGQAKLHRHMNNWIALSQQQRIQARQNFSEIKKLTPEQKTSEWEAYQALSPEEKRQLAKQAPTKPTGLAIGRPGGVQPKLVSSPRRASSGSPHLSRIGMALQPHPSVAHPAPARPDTEHSPYEDEPAE